MEALNNKEKRRLEIINLVLNKQLTQKQASIKLNMTERNFRRLIKNFKNHKELSLIHKNKGNSFAKKISEDLVSEIVNVYLNEFSDYNFSHFYEEQGFKYGISFSTLVNIFEQNDIISPIAQHKTVKLYNEKMKKAIKNKDITVPIHQLYIQRKQEELEKHIRKSALHYSFGQEVQMDAAFWIWFGDFESALHLAVDKATKIVLYGFFDYHETTQAYLVVLMNLILNYGIPNKIKTDKRNSFSVNHIRRSKSNLSITQFGRICEDLEITLLCSSDPLFKPNIERENGTFKRRLKAELRHAGITTIDDANRYLNDIFISKINKRFANDINPNKNMMRKNTYSIDELNTIISIRTDRLVDNASSIKYFHNYYLPIDLESGEVMSFKSGTICTVVNTFDNKLFGIINDNFYFLDKVETANDTNSNSSKYGFAPSSNHPWRNSFKSKY